MSTTAIVVIAIVVLFILGQVMSLRPNAAENALGNLRDKARKMGLNPRLVPYPAWLAEQLKDNMHEPKHGMVAYYSVIVDEARIPFMQALVIDQQIKVINGSETLNAQSISLKGAIALEMQSNYVALYWDEMQDIQGEHLTEMHQQLSAFATNFINTP